MCLKFGGVRQRCELEQVSYKVGWDWELIGGAKSWKAEKLRVMASTMYANWVNKEKKGEIKEGAMCSTQLLNHRNV